MWPNCGLPLPQLVAAGVDSLKIEGRLKSPLYVAATTEAYRQGLERIANGSTDLSAAQPAAGGQPTGVMCGFGGAGRECRAWVGSGNTPKSNFGLLGPCCWLLLNN